jgi:hypothetical protein
MGKRGNASPSNLGKGNDGEMHAEMNRSVGFPYRTVIRQGKGGDILQKVCATYQAIYGMVFHEHLVEAADRCEEYYGVHVVKERHPCGCQKPFRSMSVQDQQGA